VDKVPKFVVFLTISTIKDETSTAKFHYITTLRGKVVAQLIAFRVVSIYWQVVAPIPWYLNAKGPTRIGSTCVAHTSPQRGSHDVIASLDCVRLTGWPVAWNWRRAVLSADAGLLVIIVTKGIKLIFQQAGSVDHNKSSHTRTVVRECSKGDDQSQWRRANFNPPPPL